MDELDVETPVFENPEPALPIPPRKEDKLFRDDLPDWFCNACLNVLHGGDEPGYTEGYWRAARVLVNHIIEHQTDQDFLVYPIFFLYRHHVELALKNVIRRTPYLIDRELTEAEQKHLDKHRLDFLWQDLKPLFADVCKAAGWGKMLAEDEAGIDSYIRQLTSLDPESYSFRYARSKKGVPSLPAELERFNVRHFAEMMERLAEWLDGLDMATNILTEQKQEMAAAMASEYGGYE